MDRNSVVLDTSMQSRIGKGGWSHVKGKGSGSRRGCSVKGNGSAAAPAEGLQVHGGQCTDYSPAGAVAALCIAKHAVELHVETPTRQGCRDTFFELWSHH